MLLWQTIASSSKGNCYVVDNGRSLLMIEAGVPISTIRRKLGTKLSRVEGCLISHSHGDHAKSVAGIQAAAIDCYASAETFSAIGRAGHHRSVVLEPKVITSIYGGWWVMPFETVHDAPGSLGFIVGSGSDQLLFLTDTAYVRYRFNNLTHIVVEANFSLDMVRINIVAGRTDRSREKRLVETHMSIERTIDLLKANDLSKVKEIRLIHLSDENSNAEMFKMMVQEATGKPVYVEG